jgi:DNA-directed RNA polymerase specialized sigma24 family protein
LIDVMEQVDFATFVRSQTTTLVRSAYLLTGDRASAEDLVQETDVANQVSDAALVTGLLKTLPARQRAVLVMRFFHDLSDEQIAADLGIRLGTVRSIVSRSLAALREAEAANHGRRPGTAAGEVSHDR